MSIVHAELRESFARRIHERLSGHPDWVPWDQESEGALDSLLADADAMIEETRAALNREGNKWKGVGWVYVVNEFLTSGEET